MLCAVLIACGTLPPWPEGAQRSRQDSPALFGLLEADTAWVQPMAPAGRYLVVSPVWTSIVDTEAGWVRHLDHGGAMLEGCQVTRRGQRVSCHLDMVIGPQIQFSADGETRDERFQPVWAHER